MAKLRIGSEGPVDLIALGWGLTVTFLVIFLICDVAALVAPAANFSHNWVWGYSPLPQSDR
jgi:hypothetical protein